MTRLTKEEALNIRDGDVILVAMKVTRTNSHHDTRIGVKLTCFSPALDHRPREEKEKGPQLIEVLTGLSVHSVIRQEIRVKDWVAWDVVQGKVLFIDGDEVTIRMRSPVNGQRNTIQKLADLRRIPYPDLTDDEKKAFADAR